MRPPEKKYKIVVQRRIENSCRYSEYNTNTIQLLFNNSTDFLILLIITLARVSRCFLSYPQTYGMKLDESSRPINLHNRTRFLTGRADSRPSRGLVRNMNARTCESAQIFRFPMNKNLQKTKPTIIAYMKNNLLDLIRGQPFIFRDL